MKVRKEKTLKKKRYEQRKRRGNKKEKKIFHPKKERDQEFILY